MWLLTFPVILPARGEGQPQLPCPLLVFATSKAIVCGSDSERRDGSGASLLKMRQLRVKFVPEMLLNLRLPRVTRKLRLPKVLLDGTKHQTP